MKSNLIHFRCETCKNPLEISERSAGKKKTCPECSAPVLVPALPPVQEHLPAKPLRDQKSVPMRVVLGPAGSLETTVSRKDAGRVLHTIAGGLVALMGVAVAVALGVQLPKK